MSCFSHTSYFLFLIDCTPCQEVVESNTPNDNCSQSNNNDFEQNKNDTNQINLNVNDNETVKSIDQSIDQSINQSTDESTDGTTNDSSYESTDDSTEDGSSPDSENSDVDDNNNVLYHTCANCHRSQSRYLIEQYSEDSVFCMKFFQHSSDEIRLRQKFRFIQKNGTNITVFKLCRECSFFLVQESEAHEATDAKYTWPGFVWKLLNDTNVQNIYGEKIWQFLPQQWRHWWIDSIRSEFPEVYSNITIEMPPSLFVDISHDKKVWNEDIDSYMLSRLASSCNKYMLPNILCPWGCSEFNHRCGFLSLDIVWQRYLPKSLITLMNKPDQVSYINSARDDFIRFDDDYDCWLLNPKWKVRPTILIDPEKGASVLSCRDHNGGSQKLMLHLPRQPHHILPCSHPDQLCHGVIKPRTIHPLKASTYSISYQMHEQRGSFNGIDTCNITNYGRFDFCSKLLYDAECRSIGNRPDINSLLSKLCDEKKITQELANSMRESSRIFCEGIDFDSLSSSSTYVPLDTAMILQGDIYQKNVRVAWDRRGTDDNGNQRPTIYQMIKKAWPTLIFPLQRNDKFGAPFPVIPKLNTSNYNTSFLWVVCALMSRVDSLWFSIIKMNEFHQSKWHGWLLSYVSKSCFPHLCRRNDKKDPFKYSIVRKKVDHFYEKVQFYFHNHNFIDIFEEIPNVLTIEYISQFDEYIDTDLHDIVIIGNQEQELDLYDDPISITESLPNIKLVGSTEYELRVLFKMSDMDSSSSWNGEVYSRHGNYHSHWWHFSKYDTLPTQLGDNGGECE